MVGRNVNSEMCNRLINAVYVMNDLARRSAIVVSRADGFVSLGSSYRFTKRHVIPRSRWSLVHPVFPTATVDPDRTPSLSASPRDPGVRSVADDVPVVLP